MSHQAPSKLPLFFAAAFAAVVATASWSHAGITLSNNGTTAPAEGTGGISQTNSAGTVQWWTDGERQPGQSFTLASGSNYRLKGYSLRVTGQDSPQRDPWAASSTWSLQVARFENGTTVDGSQWASGGFANRDLWNSTSGSAGYPVGTQYTDSSNAFRQTTFTGVPSLGTIPAAGDWVTWTFTDAEVLELEGGYTYSIQATPINSGGSEAYAPFDVADSDVYAGGKRFSTWGGPDFGDDYVRDESLVDRAFVLNLDTVAVPEPSTCAIMAGAAIGCVVRVLRRRGR